MKLIAAILLFCSTAVLAQPQVNIGEDSKGTYRLKKDSFVIYKDGDGQYVGMTTQIVLNGKTNPSGHANYKMLAQDCDNQGSFKVLRMDDYNTEVLSSHNIKFNESSIPSAMASVICDYATQVQQNPAINNDSIQNIERYAQRTPDSKWSTDMPIGENTMATLTESIKFETIYVSMILRVRYPAKTTDYYKLYIDKDFCPKQKGHFEMKTISAIEMEDIDFDLNKAPTKEKPLHFHKIAKEMCAYTMKNNVFRKRIVIEDLNKPVENKGTMFDRK